MPLSRAALVLVLGFLPCCPCGAAGDPRDKLDVGGRSRTYLVHLPTGYSPAQRWPLVLGVHGRGQNGEGGEHITHLDEFADKNGFIVVWPEAALGSWADGRGTTPADRAHLSPDQESPGGAVTSRVFEA